MSLLSPRLQLKVAQKQILTPGLVQMVTVLQLNRLELKDMILNEIAENPILEEAADAAEELTPAEVQSLLEGERQADPVEQGILVDQAEPLQAFDAPSEGEFVADAASVNGDIALTAPVAEEPAKTETDPFDEI